MSNLIKLAEFLSQQVIELYPNQIDIVAIYGSIAQNTQNQYSDLDMYAIASLKDSKLPFNNWSFIFQNRPVDLWALSWNEAEDFVNAEKEYTKIWCVSAAIFKNSKVIYYRTDEKLKCFNDLIKKIDTIQQNKEGALRKAMSLFNNFYHFEKTLNAHEHQDILSVRWFCWGLINNLCATLAWLNNTYYSKNWGSNLQQVFQLPNKPDNLKTQIEKLCTSENIKEILSIGRNLINEIEIMIKNKQDLIKSSEIKLNNDQFVHMKEYINKIYAACNNEDILLASYASTELQIWISEVFANLEGTPVNNYEFNYFYDVEHTYINLKLPDLTGYISNIDFKGLKEATENLEDRLKVLFLTRSNDLPFFNTLEEVKSIIKE